MMASLTIYGLLRADEQTQAKDTPRITIGLPQEVIPGMAPEAVPNDSSNNNIDATRFAGRYYLAYRTAPIHYASEKAHIVLLSSLDRRSWREELNLALAHRDLREPRLLEHRGQLMLYFLEAGDRILHFVPFYTRLTTQAPDGSWSQQQAVLPRGLVLWRARSYGEVIYAAAYDGTNIYRRPGFDGGFSFLSSTDGVHWNTTQPVTWPGVTECDFDIDKNGVLTAVMRREGRSGLLCSAEKAHYDQWSCSELPYKYDSPLMFSNNGRIFLLARRSLGGRVEQAPAYWPELLRYRVNLLIYWFTRKRTALYEVLPDRRDIRWVTDFPSRGDTAYPALVPSGSSSYWMMTYSNALDGPDLPWIWGQLLLKTKIYGFDLEIR